MNNEDFLSNLKSTWQSVELPHKSLLNDAKKNLRWYWVGFVYTVLASLASIAAGLWFALNSNGDLIYWLIAFTLIILVPGLSYFSTKYSWPYAQFKDRSAKGTLNYLIKQCQISIELHLLSRKVAIAYLIVPIAGISSYFLGLTDVKLSLIIAFSLGLLTSTFIILIWVKIRLKQKHQKLRELNKMAEKSEEI